MGAAKTIIRAALLSDQETAPVTIAALFRILGAPSKKKKLKKLSRRAVENNASALWSVLCEVGFKVKRMAKGAHIVVLPLRREQLVPTAPPQGETAPEASTVPDTGPILPSEPPKSKGRDKASFASAQKYKALRACWRVAKNEPIPRPAKTCPIPLPAPALKLGWAAIFALDEVTDRRKVETWQAGVGGRGAGRTVGMVAWRQGMLMDDVIRLGKRAASITYASWSDGMVRSRPSHYLGTLRKLIVAEPRRPWSEVRIRLAAEEDLRAGLDAGMASAGFRGNAGRVGRRARGVSRQIRHVAKAHHPVLPPPAPVESPQYEAGARLFAGLRGTLQTASSRVS